MKIYCINRRININVFESQILTPLKIFNDLEFKLLVHKSFVKYNLEKDFGKKIIYFSNRFSKVLLLSKLNVKKIYTRSIFEFLTIFFVKKIFFKKYQILFDFRGISYAESILNNGVNYKNKILKKLEIFAYKKSDVTMAVSNELVNFLKKEFKFDKEVIVTPCCINVNSIKTKISFSENDVSFVYLGSIRKYQKFDLMLSVFNQISKRMPCNLTIITNDLDLAKLKCGELKVNAFIKSLPQNQVADQLINYDFGFLLRDNEIVNNVASPIKFLEYVGNGVVPILSEGIGDYSTLSRQKEIGIIYKNDINNLLKEIEKFKEDKNIFIKLSNVAQNYTWDKYKENFK